MNKNKKPNLSAPTWVLLENHNSHLTVCESCETIDFATTKKAQKEHSDKHRKLMCSSVSWSTTIETAKDRYRIEKARKEAAVKVARAYLQHFKLGPATKEYTIHFCETCNLICVHNAEQAQAIQEWHSKHDYDTPCPPAIRAWAPDHFWRRAQDLNKEGNVDKVAYYDCGFCMQQLQFKREQALEGIAGHITGHCTNKCAFTAEIKPKSSLRLTENEKNTRQSEVTTTAEFFAIQIEPDLQNIELPLQQDIRTIKSTKSYMELLEHSKTMDIPIAPWRSPSAALMEYATRIAKTFKHVTTAEWTGGMAGTPIPTKRTRSRSNTPVRTEQSAQLYLFGEDTEEDNQGWRQQRRKSRRDSLGTGPLRTNPPPTGPTPSSRNSFASLSGDAETGSLDRARSTSLPNSVSDPSDEEEAPEEDLESTQRKKERKPRPVVVKGKLDTTMNSWLNKVIPLMDETPRVRSTGLSMTIYPKTKKDKDILEANMTRDGLRYHSYPEGKPTQNRYLMRGVPQMFEISVIDDQLKMKGIEAVKLARMKSRKKDTKGEPLPLIKVTVSSDVTLKDLKTKIPRIGWVEVSWTVFKSSGKPDVCTKCQGIGHGSEECHNDPRCRLCGENHPTDECKHKGKTPQVDYVPTCANCKQHHVASWRGCTRYLAYAERKAERNPKRDHPKNTENKIEAQYRSRYRPADGPTTNAWQRGRNERDQQNQQQQAPNINSREAFPSGGLGQGQRRTYSKDHNSALINEIQRLCANLGEEAVGKMEGLDYMRHLNDYIEALRGGNKSQILQATSCFVSFVNE